MKAAVKAERERAAADKNCETCKGRGYMPDVPETESHEDCPDCLGSGWEIKRYLNRKRERCAQIIKRKSRRMRAAASSEDTSARADILEATADILDELAEAIEREEE